MLQKRVSLMNRIFCFKIFAIIAIFITKTGLKNRVKHENLQKKMQKKLSFKKGKTILLKEKTIQTIFKL